MNNTIIFGDSYSTFEGYIPEGYATYYSEKEEAKTDLRRVSETWWYQVINETKSELLLNNSWSGSTICYTGYDNCDCSQSSSFIYRLRRLIDSGFFEQNKIDRVFVFGGTNDNWANAPLGVTKYEKWEEDDLYYVFPAIAYFFNTLKGVLPKAAIYCLINTQLKPEISDEMKLICKRYSITPIAFDQIDKKDGHPTIKGMQDIKNKVINVLNNERGRN